MSMMPLRDVRLFVEVVGRGHPLVLMHGGPGTDHWTLRPFRQLRDQFTLVFYDQRCNGRSDGAPVESMTFDNLTADADALRQKLGFEKWAVLGHSFGGHVALEYALRYPENLSHLVLMDTAADSRWARENAPRVLTERGYSPEKVELVRRWFNGEFEPREMFSIFRRIGGAYQYRTSYIALIGAVLDGAWQTKFRGDTFAFAGRHLMKDWSVEDRLSDIKTPTLVIAGKQDFVFPPTSQEQLAEGIAGAQLHLIDRAGHNPHAEQSALVMKLVRQFIQPQAAISAGTPVARPATLM